MKTQNKAGLAFQGQVGKQNAMNKEKLLLACNPNRITIENNKTKLTLSSITE